MRRREDKFPDNGFEAWGGYMQAKIAKLEEQYCAKAGNEQTLSDIFNGVCIYVNGFTVPSADELKILMTKHGGVYHTYKRTDDYIIASNLPDTKVKNMNLARVVKPEWIMDSIAANRLLDYKDYLLYNYSRTQKQLNFKKNICDDSLASKSKALSYDNDIKPVKKDLVDNTKIEQDVKGKDLTKNDVKAIVSPIKILETNNYFNLLDNKPVFKQNLDAPTKTAADPNFIAEFYNNSRLHHISQLGACFKQYINDLRENSNLLFPARADIKDKLTASNEFNKHSQLRFEKNKVVMHIDMDCFFVSVGLRNRPELRGKPIAVTHSKGGQGRPRRPGVDRSTEFNLYKQKLAKKICKTSGVPDAEIVIQTRVDDIGDEDDKYGSMSEIASCSYEARAKGIGNGMFMGSALRLCPDLQTIPYDFDGYKEVAYDLYNTVAKYTLDIEAVSCDEMYVDCTELLSDLNIDVQCFATILRDEIKSKTGCPCSTGFGGNRLQARLATKKAKPDGQFFLTEDLVEDFIYNIKLRDLPGVGRQIAQKLESLGHTTCGSLQTLTLATLKTQLGNKTGAQLFDQCRGRDFNPLTFYTVRKSVSAEVNYGIRFENDNQCLEFLKQLSAEVHSRMLQFKVVGKCITLKLMVRAENAPVETAKFMGHGFCNVINKSVSLNNATNDVEIITKEVISLCKKQNVDCKEMRGIGIQVTKLQPLNNRPTMGAINKFLSLNKAIKVDIKHETQIVSRDESNKMNQEPMTKPEQQQILPSICKVKTPIKSNITVSPKKKSPISMKAQTAKRRGRPPKNLNLQQSTSKNILNFLQGQGMARDGPYRDPMLKDLKKEDLQPKIDQKPQPQPAAATTPLGLLGLSWDKVRDLLRAWLESGQTPLQCDVDMIVDYLQEMVINKNIEKLYVLMNFLKRMTKEVESEAWITVYDHITEQVQNAMVAVYGKKLYI